MLFACGIFMDDIDAHACMHMTVSVCVCIWKYVWVKAIMEQVMRLNELQFTVAEEWAEYA